MRARLFEEYITVPFTGQSYRFCFVSHVVAVKHYDNVYISEIYNGSFITHLHSYSTIIGVVFLLYMSRVSDSLTGT